MRAMSYPGPDTEKAPANPAPACAAGAFWNGACCACAKDDTDAGGGVIWSDAGSTASAAARPAPTTARDWVCRVILSCLSFRSSLSDVTTESSFSIMRHSPSREVLRTWILGRAFPKLSSTLGGRSQVIPATLRAYVYVHLTIDSIRLQPPKARPAAPRGSVRGEPAWERGRARSGRAAGQTRWAGKAG